MEKRALLAAVLMAVVFVVGQYLFPAVDTPPAPKPEAQSQVAKREPEPPPQVAAKPEPKAAPAPAPSAPAAAAARPPQSLLTVDTPLYRAVVSSEGGKLQELTLKYRGQKPLVVVGDLGPAGLIVGPPGASEPLSMRLSVSRLELDAQHPTANVDLIGQTDSVRVTETLSFAESAPSFTSSRNVSAVPTRPTSGALKVGCAAKLTTC